MFSRPHVLDLVNLLLLLVPAFLVLAVAILRGERRKLFTDHRIRFLAIAAFSVTAAAFAFEAKIGMPRDWDLFSFIGYPWMALLLLGVTLAVDRTWANRTMLVAVGIAACCLVPRAITARTPELGVRQFRDYAEIDVRKNRSGWFVLLRYHADQADSVAYRAVADLRARRFPEETVMRAADSALMRQAIDSAIQLDRIAIRINPTHAGSWANLGSCYMDKKQYDSAIIVLEISNALNPDAPRDVSLLGLAYYFVGRFDDAEEAFLQAYDLDTSRFEPVMALARLYQQTGDDERYLEWLARAVYRKEADGVWATELGDAYLVQGDVENAGRALMEALRKGTDSVEILERLKSYPELRFYMTR